MRGCLETLWPARFQVQLHGGRAAATVDGGTTHVIVAAQPPGRRPPPAELLAAVAAAAGGDEAMGIFALRTLRRPLLSGDLRLVSPRHVRLYHFLTFIRDYQRPCVALLPSIAGACTR